jgi:hypothetical protein
MQKVVGSSPISRLRKARSWSGFFVFLERLARFRGTALRTRRFQDWTRWACPEYASRVSPPATLVMWFKLRSAELAEDFERLMTEDRDIVRGSLDTVGDWRLTRPADVPGQSIGQADYVLIAEVVEVERFEQEATEHIQRLEGALEHLVSSRGMLVGRPVL